MINTNMNNIIRGQVVVLNSSRFGTDARRKTITFKGKKYESHEVCGEIPHLVIRVDEEGLMATIIPLTTIKTKTSVPINIESMGLMFLELTNIKPIDYFVIGNSPTRGFIPEHTMREIDNYIARYFKNGQVVDNSIDIHHYGGAYQDISRNKAVGSEPTPVIKGSAVSIRDSVRNIGIARFAPYYTK